MQNTNRILLTLLLLIGLLMPAVASAQKGGLRYTVTVSKFDNDANWTGQWVIGDAWGAVLTDLLNQSGKFIVLGEADMRNEAMAEQDLGASGRTAKGAKTPEIGQLTPAQLLVKGSITHVQQSTTGGSGGVRIRGVRIGGSKDSAEVTAVIYMVDSTTGQVLASTTVTGKSDRTGLNLGLSTWGFGGDVETFKKDNVGKAVTAACSDAVDWLVLQLPNIPWRGSVALIKDGKVYVNRGTREGVQVGQNFVVGEPEVIRDPDTGEVLDESVKEVARLQVESVKEKLSICRVTSGTVAKVKKGMGVQEQ